MIIYNNILRPVHDPPHDPLLKICVVATRVDAPAKQRPTIAESPSLPSGMCKRVHRSASRAEETDVKEHED